jgi:hypothetical protein
MNIFYGVIIAELLLGKLLEIFGILNENNLIFDGVVIAADSIL